MSTQSEAQRELESAERDLANALQFQKELLEKLEQADGWVREAIKREQEARLAFRAIGGDV